MAKRMFPSVGNRDASHIEAEEFECAESWDSGLKVWVFTFSSEKYGAACEIHAGNPGGPKKFLCGMSDFSSKGAATRWKEKALEDIADYQDAMRGEFHNDPRVKQIYVAR